MKKHWYQSKTLWFNVITLILGVVGAILGVIQTKLWVIVLTGIMGLGNTILRVWFTDTGIASAAPPTSTVLPPTP